MKKIYLTLFLMLGALMLSAQDVVTTQPSIVVVPLIKQGEDYRTVLENDPNMRVVINEICNAFNSRLAGSTKNLIAELQQQSQSSEVYGGGTQQDLKSLAAQTTGADIYVQAEIQTHFASSGNSVDVILTAYDIAGGPNVSNKNGSSGELYSNNVAALARRALARITDDFLNDIQNYFNRIVLEGRTMKVEFLIAEGVDVNFRTEVGTDEEELGDEIVEWIQKNAYKNQSHRLAKTTYRIMYDVVKIPIRDEDGNNYDPETFARKLNKFLKSFGLTSERDIVGNFLHVTIDGLKE